MRIVRSGKHRQNVSKKVVECRDCQCQFEVESDDLARLDLVSDWRDGDFYYIPCPECEKISTFAAILFQ